MVVICSFGHMCILPTKGNYMSTIDVLDRNTNKTVKAKIDQEDYDRLKTYKYIIDKNNEKPFREEKVNNQVRRIFLARDVSNFKFGDGRVVRVKNKDITDCRKINLEEGKVRAGALREGKGVFWPQTFKSFLNFLDARKGVDEDLVYYFLTKAHDVKYTWKLIALIFSSEDYVEFQSKQVLVAFKRILHKYFEWGGKVTAIKDMTISYKKEVEKKEIVELQVKKKDLPPMMQRVFDDLQTKKEKAVVVESYNYADVCQILTIFLNQDPKNAQNILTNPRLFLIEDVVSAVNGRMSTMTLQFNSK